MHIPVLPPAVPVNLGQAPNSPRLMALVARQAVPPLWGYIRYSSAPVPTALVLDISTLDFSSTLQLSNVLPFNCASGASPSPIFHIRAVGA